MSDLDVSLRLRLVNQLSRPAEEAERDLKELKKAAEQLGRTGSAGGLAGDLGRVGKEADNAKAKLGAVEKEAADLRRTLGRVDDGALANLKSDADGARRAIGAIGDEANEARRKLGQLDDNALAGLKSDARAAETAIEQIGKAAGTTQERLKQLQMQGRGISGAHGNAGVPGRRGGLFGETAGAAFDRLGGDAYLPLGAGAAYMAGGVIASGGVVAGAAIRAAAGDELTSDNLRVLGEYSAEDQARYDRIMAGIGARKGTGTGGAMNVFGRLMAGGLDAEGAAASTEAAIMFGKATQASPEDAARTTIALRNTFGIGTDDIMGAYDAMAMGGKAGEFEVPDMAKNFPSIASKMAALGEGGLSGTRLLVALGQSIRKTAGTSDQASTNFENMLGKFRSQDFIKNAEGFGIDVEKTVKGANAAGKSPVMALLEEIQGKVGTDGFKLAKLMPDVEARAGLEASLNGLKDVKKLMTDMEAAPGTVMKDFATATENASSAFDRFTANIAAKAKFLAAYALPPLTDAMNALSDAMEGDREPQQIKAPDDASGAVKDQIHAANDRGARMNRFFENLFGFEKSDASKRLDTIDAYRQYGQSRNEGERGGPSAWRRWLLGSGAEPGFDHRENFGIKLRPTAENSMSDYNAALTSEGAKAEGIAQGIAESIKSILGFTVSPTITPSYVPAGGAGEKHGAVQQPAGGGTKLTQNIYSPNAKHAAMRSVKEQNRAFRQAQARSYAGTGRSLA